MPEQVKVDFKQLKSIPIERVLEHYGVRVHGSGPQLTADCPLPTHTSQTRSSFKVNAEKNIWTCKSDSCSQGYKAKLNGKRGGDCLDLVALKEDCSILQAAKLLLEWFPQHGNTKIATVAKSEPEPEPPTNKPLTFALKGIQYCDYLGKRGITKATADEFGVGLFPGKGIMTGRVLIPIHDKEGTLMAYAGRALNGQDPKYKLPPHFHKSLLIYNLHRVGDLVDTVIVVEGFFSVLWLTQCGFPNVVSLMGHSISDAQLELLNFRKVILMLDNNEGGKEERERTLIRIASKCFVRNLSIPSQPDHLSKEELENLLKPLLH
jgi:hypothetical protein